MARLTKAEWKAHAEAEKILAQDHLTDDERQFVLTHWQESANHVNSSASAFFTPVSLALDVALFAGVSGGSRKVVDLCAGIGALGLAAWWRSDCRAEITCIEVNPDYVAVGRKLFPEARWICADINDLPAGLGRFDCAIANPPFGRMTRISGPRYRGVSDLAVVDIASDLADWGTFILPGSSVPFQYSGRPMYREQDSSAYRAFREVTQIELSAESIDCAVYDGWHGVRPQIEMVSADFTEARRARRGKETAGIPAADLFSWAA